MRRLLLCLAIILMTPWGPRPQEADSVPESTESRIEDSTEEPVEIDKTEEVAVNLVMIEVLVVDREDRTVPDLTRDDFELTVEGLPVPIDVFDVNCPAGRAEDPIAIRQGERREPIAPEEARKIVLVVNYYNLEFFERTDVILQARAAVLLGKTPNESVMVVALADGLRIEQPFTTDASEIVETLDRMEYDRSLQDRHFGRMVGPRAIFNNLAALMDLLGTYDGTKAVILYAGGFSKGNRRDTLYRDVAQRAAASRSVIYPTSPRITVLGPSGLDRLAQESGGRTTWSNDLTWAYARAQRDLACRYAIGFYTESSDQRHRKIRIRVNREGATVRFPATVRTWTEEERRESRMRAAFATPERFDEPLVRALVIPTRPHSTRAWETIAAMNFPFPTGDDRTVLHITGTVKQEHVRVEKFRQVFDLDPAPANDSGPASATMIRSFKLRPGSYDLTFVMSSPGDSSVHTSRSSFVIPEVPSEGLFANGPFLAREVEQGLLLRGDENRDTTGSLGALVGGGGGVEPLIVHQIGTDDALLAFWEVCTLDAKSLPVDATVQRRIVWEKRVIRKFKPIPLELPGRGKVRCHGQADRMPPRSVLPGRYKLRLSVEDAATGEELAVGIAPFMVK